MMNVQRGSEIYVTVALHDTGRNVTGGGGGEERVEVNSQINSAARKTCPFFVGFFYLTP